uniref:CARD domain-containing protein n=1 Tax=Neogobius melanostomus TaxID=47308 RepID=A0A8C6STA7_9GOBI
MRAQMVLQLFTTLWRANLITRQLLYSQAEGVLNPGEKDYILEEHRSRADRARVLFDTVMRKGNTSIEIMMERFKTQDAALYSHLFPDDLK